MISEIFLYKEHIRNYDMVGSFHFRLLNASIFHSPQRYISISKPTNILIILFHTKKWSPHVEFDLLMWLYIKRITVPQVYSPCVNGYNFHRRQFELKESIPKFSEWTANMLCTNCTFPYTDGVLQPSHDIFDTYVDNIYSPEVETKIRHLNNSSSSKHPGYIKSLSSVPEFSISEQ